MDEFYARLPAELFKDVLTQAIRDAKLNQIYGSLPIFEMTFGTVLKLADADGRDINEVSFELHGHELTVSKVANDLDKWEVSVVELCPWKVYDLLFYIYHENERERVTLTREWDDCYILKSVRRLFYVKLRRRCE